MVTSVFDRGRLLAAHAVLRTGAGSRGGASHKRSTAVPGLDDLLHRLGGGLDWHGALSLDVILGPSGPVVIDVNPRLVEPVNAARAGLDLPGLMLALAADRGHQRPGIGGRRRAHPPAAAEPAAAAGSPAMGVNSSTLSR